MRSYKAALWPPCGRLAGLGGRVFRPSGHLNRLSVVAEPGGRPLADRASKGWPLVWRRAQTTRVRQGQMFVEKAGALEGLR